MKLNPEMARQVASAESTYVMAPIGTHVIRLVDVQAKDGRQAPYWEWKFEIAEGEAAGATLYENTSLSEKALWRLNAMFSAFGVPTDTSTDDMIGMCVIGVVDHIVQQQGKGAGNLRAELVEINPMPESDQPTEEEPF